MLANLFCWSFGYQTLSHCVNLFLVAVLVSAPAPCDRSVGQQGNMFTDCLCIGFVAVDSMYFRWDSAFICVNVVPNCSARKIFLVEKCDTTWKSFAVRFLRICLWYPWFDFLKNQDVPEAQA